MLIAATADIHSPRFYGEFVEAVERLKVKPDLFLIAGDMVSREMPEEYEKIYNVLSGRVFCPVVACFGNSEWIPDKRNDIKEKYRGIRFVDDDVCIVKVGTSSAGIVGTIGSLDTPTTWQLKNIPNVQRIYEDRIGFVGRHLERIMTEVRIVLMHYSPTYETLDGENPRFFGSMGSKAYDLMLRERKPDVVIHGHSHRGKKMAWLDTVPVFNVSLPLNRQIVLINTENLKQGIAKFIRP